MWLFEHRVKYAVQSLCGCSHSKKPNQSKAYSKSASVHACVITVTSHGVAFLRHVGFETSCSQSRFEEMALAWAMPGPCCASLSHIKMMK